MMMMIHVIKSYIHKIMLLVFPKVDHRNNAWLIALEQIKLGKNVSSTGIEHSTSLTVVFTVPRLCN